MGRTTTRLVMAAATMSAMAYSGIIGAQDAAPATSGGAPQASELAEVVVTAEKRTERLQDVPLSITAVTEQSLNQQGIIQLNDLVSRVPGLHLSQDSTQSDFTVRGIASSTTAGTTSATAGVYIDNYPLYDTWDRFGSPDIHLFDVQRVEVLRGPQGTLYGATSLAGMIRIITNKPDLDAFDAAFEGTGSSTEGGRANYDANGMVNIPLVDGKLAIRAVAYSQGQGGYIDNVLRGSDVNGEQSSGGRLLVAAQPAEDWNIQWELLAQHDLHHDQNASYYFPSPGRTDSDFNSVLPTRTQSDLLVSVLTVDKKLGGDDLNFSATAAHNEVHVSDDFTPLATLLGAPSPTPISEPSHADIETLEVRYASDAAKPLRYIIGAYYDTRYRILAQNAEQSALTPLYGTGQLYAATAGQRASETAIYGEATWQFARKWTSTVGLRVFNNDYIFDGNVFGVLNNPVAPLAHNITALTNSNTSATPRLSLSYEPRPTRNFYATVSEGYRFGLTNYNSGANGGIPLTYKPDTLWNYEVGSKASYLDGRASLDTSLYYEIWRDMQVSFRNANGQIYITNAGNARSYGIENELSLRPTPAWQFNATLSLGEAALTTDNPGIQARAASIRGPGIYGVRAGMRLPGSERVAGDAGAQYNIPDVIGSADAYIRLDDTYVGSSYVDFLESGSLKIGGYNLVGARIGLNFAKYQVVLFADNMLNSRGIENATPDGDILGGTDWAYRVHPRTIGLTLRADY